VVGGGGAPEVTLPSWSVALPERYAVPLRMAAILGRVEKGRLLLDLRCVPPSADEALTAAVIAAAGKG
jgi:L-seryl-tRNA(Ser) seleniumtransferase